MNNEIMVSVICPVYNHEKYLRKCIDGFIMQKTDFKFEVLIHDDASTDSSADIIREYQENYPDIIKPIFQSENQYSKGIKIAQKYLHPRANGKYIAFCEGDDYWCDENKLQKQFDALENHPECSMCVCKVKNIFEDGKESNSFHPSSKFHFDDGVIKNIEILSLFPKYFFQTSGYFVRKEYVLEYDAFFEKVLISSPVGDVPLLNFLMTKGDLFYIPDIMSCYRMNSSSSFSKNLQDYSIMIDYAQKRKKMHLAFLEYLKNNNILGVEKILQIEENIKEYDAVRMIDAYVLKNDYKAIFKSDYRKYLFKNRSNRTIICFFIRALKQK